MAFNAEDVAKSLRTAMKGAGTDENRIIKEITSHTKVQRQDVKKAYMTMYGHQLEEDIKSELSGNFLTGVLALLMPTDDYEAQCMRLAIKGIGTNQRVCINLLCSKEAHEIRVLKEAYKRIYQRDLDKDMENEESGALGRLFRSLTLGQRAETSEVDFNLAKKEAQELYDAGQGRIGTDEVEFVRIFCSRSFPQLRQTFEEYYKVSNTDIEKAIKKEMSGNLEDAFLALVKCVRNKPGYFAEQLYNSMKGLGTRDDDLIRLLVCRSEIDLPKIKTEYQRMYGKSLHDAVKSETSGDYRKLFLALIGTD